MNKARTIACTVLAASLGVSSISFAQPSHHEAQRDAREARHDTREARHDMREAQREMHHARQERREAREERRDERFYYNAHEFRRGQRLPPELRHRQYVVANWRVHRLAPPPRGYQWVQVGSDYVLVAIATGIIANLILSQ